MPRPRAIIFDLDGTLVDSLQDIADTVDACLRAAGLPTHDLTAYRDMVGDGLATLVRRAIPQGADHPALLAAIRARYATHCLDTTRAYPGIPELIHALRADGIVLAVLSNKPHALTVAVVDRLFPVDTFVAVVGEREGVPRKPDPTAAIELLRQLGASGPECLFVGDTPIDIATAGAAGIPSVAVTWGFRHEAVLRGCGPDHVVDRPRALLDLLR